MKHFPRLLLLLGFLFHAASVIADTTPIKVGAILILTGANAEYGVQAQRGAQLAVDDINQAGGVGGRPLSIIWEDETAGKAERAVSAYRKLVHVDGVKFILGPSFQDGLLAIAPLAKTDGIALVTPSTPSQGLPQVFGTWIDPSIEADHIAQHIRKTSKTVSVLAAQQSWELMVADAFKSKFRELGGEVVSYAAPQYQTKYQTAPDNPSFQAYDAVHLLAKAIEAKGEKPSEVLKYLSSFDSFDGASGTIRTIGGRTLTSMGLFRANGGEFKRMD
jgi:ABC-type branched-subunit amino acid transport system substrate-binding protein